MPVVAIPAAVKGATAGAKVAAGAKAATGAKAAAGAGKAAASKAIPAKAATIYPQSQGLINVMNTAGPQSVAAQGAVAPGAQSVAAKAPMNVSPAQTQAAGGGKWFDQLSSMFGMGGEEGGMINPQILMAARNNVESGIATLADALTSGPTNVRGLPAPYRGGQIQPNRSDFGLMQLMSQISGR